MMKKLLFLDELRAQSNVFVACSGGIDSMVLLHFLHGAGMAVHALHCNFQLRGDESDADETFVQACCENLHIPISIKRFDTNILKKNDAQSIQQLARDLRYSWFDELLENHPNSLLCTAHHRDDHEEQVWMRLLSSGRILDLGGILSQRDSIRRPLMNIAKIELFDYAEAHGISWREDESNSQTDYTRNKIRHDLNPVLQNIDSRHHAAALRLADEVQKIRKEGDQILRKNLGNTIAQGEFLVSSQFWENQLFLTKELLLETWRNSNTQLDEIERFYQHAKWGSRLELPDGYYIIRENKGLWFGQHALDEFQILEIHWTEPTKEKTYDVQQVDCQTEKIAHSINLTDRLYIKPIDIGDELHFANGKIRKIKKVFNDEKWMHHERKKALGWYLNNKLIGIIKPFEVNALELAQKSSGKMMKIIKFQK